MKSITSLEQLTEVLNILPNGTTCDVLPEDLDAGNFDIAHFELLCGSIDIPYTGPVREGYVSPFEQGE